MPSARRPVPVFRSFALPDARRLMPDARSYDCSTYRRMLTFIKKPMAAIIFTIEEPP